jgi:hypothetical protein
MASKGILLQDAGTFPANSGKRKAPLGGSKQIKADNPQFDPKIKGPVISPAGAGDKNTADNTKTDNYW